MSGPSAERLRGAAAIVREHGLAKGHYQEAMARCTVGALAQAVRPVSVFDVQDEVRYLSVMLGFNPWAEPQKHYRVSEWNDLPETTAEDVINLLEQAAEKLEADQ